MQKRVLLAMSGGTDSSVCAMLLKEQNYSVTGIHFSFFSKEWASEQVLEEQEKSSKSVKETCQALEIDCIELEKSDTFYSQVVSYFVSEYFKGRTPFPCAVCNPLVKWKILYKTALSLNFDYIASGHYVQKTQLNNNWYITEGIDKDKDQSFFLWGLQQNVLEKTLFPLGLFTKDKTRNIAKEKGFKSISKKKDSLGICFLHNKDYRPFIIKELEKQNIHINDGNFIDSNNNKIGTHKGYIHFTVGQRKQLGITHNTRVFVNEICPENNTVKLSDFNNMFKTEFTVKNYYFHSLTDLETDIIYVKIRYRNQKNECNIHIINDTSLRINLKTPLESISPGQTAVFYKNNLVIGGGFIE